MREYLEQILHQNIIEHSYQDTGRLPLSCKNAFELTVIKIGQQEFLLAAPTEDISLTELRKMRLQLERYTGYPCVFHLKRINWYAAPKMIEEGIPFIWENHEVYLPFTGILLQEKKHRIIKNCSVISFLTQKLLLKALYENWQDISVTDASAKLEVSGMSVTRCYDEIEAMGMPFLTVRGKSRRFHAIEDRKQMWNTMAPFLRDPVIRIFRLERKLNIDMILSGVSALSSYSLLEEGSCVTYGVLKKQVEPLGLKAFHEVPINETPACIVQELGYILPLFGSNAVDPLSLKLMLTEDDFADPRVEACLNDALEELVW